MSKIKCKATPAARRAYTTEEIGHYVGQSVSESLGNPPLPGRADTYYWDTDHGKLLVMVEWCETYWQCYLSIVGEVEIEEDGLYGRHHAN